MVTFVDSAVSTHCRQLSTCFYAPVMQLVVFGQWRIIKELELELEVVPKGTIHLPTPKLESEANWVFIFFL